MIAITVFALNHFMPQYKTPHRDPEDQVSSNIYNAPLEKMNLIDIFSEISQNVSEQEQKIIEPSDKVSFIQLPSFRANLKDPETMQLREKYLKCRDKIQAIFLDQNVVDQVLKFL